MLGGFSEVGSSGSFKETARVSSEQFGRLENGWSTRTPNALSELLQNERSTGFELSRNRLDDIYLYGSFPEVYSFPDSLKKLKFDDEEFYVLGLLNNLGRLLISGLSKEQRSELDKIISEVEGEKEKLKKELQELEEESKMKSLDVSYLQ